jgi:hypothetical protein
MPKLGDTVDVSMTIQGDVTFDNKKGTVISASTSQVEVSVPLLNGIWLLKQIPSNFQPISPGHWQITAQLKLS